ncbi:MAG: CheR family methyltransferase [Candidatus Sulfotelmatobacter sp.]
MAYVYSRPTSTSFTGKGLLGYTFGPLNQREVDIYYIDSEKGHDTFMISKKITRIYYVLSGNGCFTIGGNKFDIHPGMLVEVPPKVEYCYSGQLTMLAFATPRWFGGNDTHTKWNPDVVGQSFPCTVNGGSKLTRLARLRAFGRSPVGIYLRLNEKLWRRLPSSIIALSPVHMYGNFLQRLAQAQGGRAQAFSTYFLRNRPELELIRRLAERWTQEETLKVAVLGCSTGVEAYSIAWRIRSVRPDLSLVLQAVDISKQAVEFASHGVYSLAMSELTNTVIFERMTVSEMEEFFERTGEVAKVRSWIKECIKWCVGDVGEPEICDALGGQDIVVANNFLCHMEPEEAERCLRNIARAVKPNGYLFVSGIDLDVRTKVAHDLGWQPLEELFEEIHNGDQSMLDFWPFHYGGVEPLNKNRRDWRTRYASAFRLVPGPATLPESSVNERDEEWSRPKPVGKTSS